MRYLCLLFATLMAMQSTANSTTFWTFSNEKTINVEGHRSIIPTLYQIAKLDVSAFQLSQAFIPSEESGNTSIIVLPTPHGEEMEFKIYEKPMMEKALADKYPQIKTYTAYATNDARITAKIDFTVFGFHAVVFNGVSTYYIDPYSNMNKEWYVVYFKKDYNKSLNHRMQCLVDEDIQTPISNEPIHLDENELSGISFKTSGDTIRTYRLALACTQEYAAAVGGATPTKASVLSAMVTSINRVNGVFEKEFSMHANLVANNDTLIFLPGPTDPYTNGSGSAMLGENQTTVTARIGAANYDFGHVFSTGGGGIASLACVCASNKAQGVTGSASPVGDPFDIDYVAHEMGHQFGGSHTFNSVTSSCNGNRSSQSAYEIGSGSTIMSYAGICGADDIQPHSDDYYHVRSLEQMTGTTVKACASLSISGNTPPVLSSINKTYIVPYKTPFEINASASDANGDPLNYCWEQYNRGGSGNAWDDPTTVAPILRSFYPDTSGTRVFPAYKELIKNTESYLGERLPDTARILKFRCTVRDFHSGYGAFHTSTDTTKIDTRATTTLFRVTSQNTTGQVFNAFSTQTVTWNVAGTNAAPIAATNVNIYLSIDSGRTWPYTLAANTSNDGSEIVTMPNVETKWARIKVKGAGNVFFDLNDKWIEIKKSPAAVKDIKESEFNIYPNPAHDVLTIKTNASIPYQLKITNILGTTLLSKEINTIETLDVSSFANGIYFVNITASSGTTLVKKVTLE